MSSTKIYVLYIANHQRGLIQCLWNLHNKINIVLNKIGLWAFARCVGDGYHELLLPNMSFWALVTASLWSKQLSEFSWWSLNAWHNIWETIAAGKLDMARDCEVWMLSSRSLRNFPVYITQRNAGECIGITMQFLFCLEFISF